MTKYVFTLYFDEIEYHEREQVIVHTIFGLVAAFTKAIEAAGDRQLRNVTLVSSTKA